MIEQLTVKSIHVNIEQYTPVWHKGTGLPASLPPGTHQVSTGWVRDGQEYVEIDGDFYTTREHMPGDSF